MHHKFLILFLFISFIHLDAQQNDFWESVRFGGGIGLSFGNNTTNIAVAPSAIYEFDETVALGASIGYQYAKRFDEKFSVFSFGMPILVNPLDEIQLSAEFEQLFINSNFNGIKDNYNYPALYFGAAYRVSNYVAVGIRYDVLYNSNESIYSSAFTPIVRVFF